MTHLSFFWLGRAPIRVRAKKKKSSHPDYSEESQADRPIFAVLQYVAQGADYSRLFTSETSTQTHRSSRKISYLFTVLKQYITLEPCSVQAATMQSIPFPILVYFHLIE